MPSALAAELFDLTGRVCVVTGASSGLGRHFAEALADSGGRVVVAARRLDLVEDLAAGIVARGGEAMAVRCDARDAASLAGLASAAVGRWGRIDVLVNNAGVQESMGPVPAETTPDEEWDRIHDTNLKAAFRLSVICARQMAKQEPKGGSIVNVASILGLRGDMWTSAYGTSKAGLVHLTKVLAMEWAPVRVRVNCLCPGYYHTDINDTLFTDPPDGGSVGPESGGFGPFRKAPLSIMQRMAGKDIIENRIPQRRLGDPKELIGALLLLCAPGANSYLTGQAIAVDGGQMVGRL